MILEMEDGVIMKVPQPKKKPKKILL